MTHNRLDDCECHCNDWQYCQRSPRHNRDPYLGVPNAEPCRYCTPEHGVRFAGQCPFAGEVIG